MLQTRLSLGLKDQGRALGLEAFSAAEFEEPYRYERMGGRLVVMSPSGLEHNRVVWHLLRALSAFDLGRPGVQRERVPAVVFEVVSQGSEERDYVIKRREYFDAGVGEYIIVDPVRKALTVLVPGEAGYLDRELGPDDVYRSDQLPGFQLSVSDLPF